MTDRTENLEATIREKVTYIATEMRRRADEFDRIAAYRNVEDIPGLVAQAMVNAQLNLRLDLPAVWLGELVKHERAERLRGSADT